MDIQVAKKIVMQKVRPMYDIYSYGLDNGWRIELIVASMILEAVTSSVNDIDEVECMPLIHNIIQDVLDVEMDMLELINAVLTMRSDGSPLMKRMKELGIAE